MNTIKKYIKENIFCRCGQAVSRLAASDLIPRPEMPTSEAEVHEWWLVSAELAGKLRADQHPILEFGELNMWGRSATGVALEDDQDLIDAIGQPPARPGPAGQPAKRTAARRRR